MSNLKDLYLQRDLINAQIAAVEKKERLQGLIPIIEDTALKSLPITGIDGKIIVAMEYENNLLTRIAISSNADKINDFDIVEDVIDDNDDDDDDDNDNDDDDGNSGTKRKKSIPFSVHFADGKVIDEPSAKRTMIEAFRYMGLERASKYEGKVKGFPIIGRIERKRKGKSKLQKYVDGWWIYTCLNNLQKIEHIKNIGKMLNIPLEIKLKYDKMPDDPELPKKQKGKRAMFSLNGGPAFCKNRSVLNTVKQFIFQMSSATFQDVCDFFHRELQGSYGVVKSLNEIQRRKIKNRTEEGRWFLEPEEILTASDGVRFAVCTEWGDNFASFQKHVAEQLGWTLEEVE